MRFFLFLLSFLYFLSVYSQQNNKRVKTLAIAKKIQIDSVSINPSFFTITHYKKEIDTSYYEVDFTKAILYFKKEIGVDSITISYLKYPDFLTQRYRATEKQKIIPDLKSKQKRYRLIALENKTTNPFLQTLQAKGNLSRGISVGNNQNAVVNSALDLQLAGKISDNISLKAHIKDSDIPLQNEGYSQRVDEFDALFVSLQGPKWQVNAGDVLLQNKTGTFLQFEKKIQGIITDIRPKNLQIKNSIAMVRGRYTQSNFTAQEANQGPYKLKGSQQELFVVLVPGSERVYANGILLQKDKQYEIDYNAAELTFTPNFPVNSSMRIVVEYQYTNTNYSRYIAFHNTKYHNDSFTIEGAFYQESDLKNSPIGQTITQEQAQILAQAGDDIALQKVSSIQETTYDANSIQYYKSTLNGTEILVHASDNSKKVYRVIFSYQGENKANYIIKNNNAIGKIYAYVAPINGVLQGNYAPVTTLKAPEKQRIAMLKAGYTPSDKTNIHIEIAASNTDKNLYATKDKQDDNAVAATLKASQVILQKDRRRLQTFFSLDKIDANFKSIEPIYNMEFSRDWNLQNTTQNTLQDQQWIKLGAHFTDTNAIKSTYYIENLQIKNTYSGIRQHFNNHINIKRWNIQNTSSLLQSKQDTGKTFFTRHRHHIQYKLSKKWVWATNTSLEENKQNLAVKTNIKEQKHDFYISHTDSVTPSRFGYTYATTDSISTEISKVKSSTYYLETTAINNKKTNLYLQANYRIFKDLKNKQNHKESVNGKLQYQQKWLKNNITTNTFYQTTSGSMAVQDFTFVAVDPGKGVYTWIDYNDNSIAEIDEFEIANFTDQANYVKILLANQNFIKTQQNKWTQALHIKPLSWQKKTGFLKTLAKMEAECHLHIDQKTKQQKQKLKLPFTKNQTLIAQNKQLKASFYIHRNQKKHAFTYSYLQNDFLQNLATGSQTNKQKQHRIQYHHMLHPLWEFKNETIIAKNKASYDNFNHKNYNITDKRTTLSLVYSLAEDNHLSMHYKMSDQKNTMAEKERLQQHDFYIKAQYIKPNKLQLQTEIHRVANGFTGNAYSAVAYQLLQGLQPGVNYTWFVLFQKRLSAFLHLNLQYNGRKTPNNKTIHTGSIALKAFF